MSSKFSASPLPAKPPTGSLSPTSTLPSPTALRAAFKTFLRNITGVAGGSLDETSTPASSSLRDVVCDVEVLMNAMISILDSLVVLHEAHDLAESERQRLRHMMLTQLDELYAGVQAAVARIGVQIPSSLPS